MGYSTTFTGRIEIEPPLNRSGRKSLEDFSEARHDDRRTGAFKTAFPSIHCDFHATPDGSAIVWNGTEKTYEAEAWIRYIVDNWVHATGRKANGELLAQGEESADVWKIKVRDNQVTRVNGHMVFSEDLEG